MIAFRVRNVKTGVTDASPSTVLRRPNVRIRARPLFLFIKPSQFFLHSFGQFHAVILMAF